MAKCPLCNGELGANNEYCPNCHKPLGVLIYMKSMHRQG